MKGFIQVNQRYYSEGDIMIERFIADFSEVSANEFANSFTN